jgi:hypothetical protein
MKPERLPPTQFRIFISDGRTKFYLRDWIVYDKHDNLVFDAERQFAMIFKNWNMAMKYRERMILLDYHPHIEAI